MKLLFLSLCMIFGTISTGSVSGNSANSVVYICTGPKAEVYHKIARCRGLEHCSDDVVSVSLAKAKEMGRRACKICY